MADGRNAGRLSRNHSRHRLMGRMRRIPELAAAAVQGRAALFERTGPCDARVGRDGRRARSHRAAVGPGWPATPPESPAPTRFPGGGMALGAVGAGAECEQPIACENAVAPSPGIVPARMPRAELARPAACPPWPCSPAASFSLPRSPSACPRPSQPSAAHCGCPAIRSPAPTTASMRRSRGIRMVRAQRVNSSPRRCEMARAPTLVG